MKYKHVFWDWNGTLFNDTALCHEITNMLLLEIGAKELSFDEYRKKLRHPIKEFYDEITNTDCAASYSKFSDKFHEHYETRRYQCKIHEHVEENIEFFKSQGARQSILSAHPQYLLDSIVAHLKAAHHFEHIVGASDKLAKDKFQDGARLMKLTGAAPESTLIIGDTDHDAAVAELLGIDCIIVAQGMQCRTKLSHLKYPVLNSMSEIKALVLPS